MPHYLLELHDEYENLIILGDFNENGTEKHLIKNVHI